MKVIIASTEHRSRQDDIRYLEERLPWLGNRHSETLPGTALATGSKHHPRYSQSHTT